MYCTHCCTDIIGSLWSDAVASHNTSALAPLSPTASNEWRTSHGQRTLCIKCRVSMCVVLIGASTIILVINLGNPLYVQCICAACCTNLLYSKIAITELSL